MNKLLLLLVLFSCLIFAQNTQMIEFDKRIKDKTSQTKSLTFIDNRTDKEIGQITNKKGVTDFKLPDENMNTVFENWFEEDNKNKGKNDIVVVLDELKFYNEQIPNDKDEYIKAKIKVASFLKRGDKYYFIDRYENVIVSDPKKSVSAPNYLANAVSDKVAELIKNSYNHPINGEPIAENEIANYEDHLEKANKSLNQELKDGVYLDFKSFADQNPADGHYIEKNRKGRVVRLKDKSGFSIALGGVFGYVENGIAYRLTPSGFKEMKKDDQGYYIVSSRSKLFADSNVNGAMIGGIAGGLVGAAIGAAIDSGSRKGSIQGIGFSSPTMTNVYTDSLTGDYVFKH